MYKIASEVVESRSKASGCRDPDRFHQGIISRQRLHWQIWVLISNMISNLTSREKIIFRRLVKSSASTSFGCILIGLFRLKIGYPLPVLKIHSWAVNWNHQTPGSAPLTSFSITGSIQFTNPPLKSYTKCQAVTSSPFNCQIIIISRLLTYDQLNWIMNTIMNLVLVSSCRTADECELWCCCCHSPLTHLVAQVERRPNQMTARN